MVTEPPAVVTEISPSKRLHEGDNDFRLTNLPFPAIFGCMNINEPSFAAALENAEIAEIAELTTPTIQVPDPAPPAKRKPGRPKMTDGAAKHHVLFCRVTPDFRDLIQTAAASDGLTVSAWVHLACQNELDSQAAAFSQPPTVVDVPPVTPVTPQ